ncbi:MAG: fibronectin type III domain-containing protein, partial [Myxococcota bacterium]|nr:fibronectin type III domain-containing protein [Myxococcota bacterium]
VAYEVVQDGLLLAQVGGQTTEFAVTGLSPWTEYDFRVTAIDQANNRALVDLQLLQRTADEGLPTWSNGAMTTANVTPSSLTLNWSAAQDDVAVTAYVIAQNGMEIARTDGATLTIDVNGLSPWTDYTYTVTAVDVAGNTSAQPLTVTQKTPDTVKPTFPAGAALSIADLTSTSATVRWPKATDDVAVTRYEVAIDGGPKPAVDGQTTELLLDALRPMRTYLITVRAYDEANNPSLELSTSITTPDGGPPSWAGKKLTATAGITEVQLSWDAAIDDVAVTGYRLYQGQVLIYEGVERQWLVEGLTAENQYTFSVQAQDGAGNWSVDGPTASVTTAKAYDPGFQRLTKAQFLNTITDVYWYLWEDTCRHPNRAQDCGDPNHVFYRGRDKFYQNTLSDIGVHGAATFPSDEAVPPAGAPGRGFSRFDARVYGGNVIAWTKSSLSASQAWRDWVESYYIWHNSNLDG